MISIYQVTFISPKLQYLEYCLKSTKRTHLAVLSKSQNLEIFHDFLGLPWFPGKAFADLFLGGGEVAPQLLVLLSCHSEVAWSVITFNGGMMGAKLVMFTYITTSSCLLAMMDAYMIYMIGISGGVDWNFVKHFLCDHEAPFLGIPGSLKSSNRSMKALSNRADIITPLGRHLVVFIELWKQKHNQIIRSSFTYSQTNSSYVTFVCYINSYFKKVPPVPIIARHWHWWPWTFGRSLGSCFL